MSLTLWLGTYLLHSTVICGCVALFRNRLRQVPGAEYLWRSAMCLPLASATLALLSDAESGVVTARLQAPDIPVGWMDSSSVVAAALACLTLGAVLVIRDLAAYCVFVRRVGLREPADTATVSLVSDVLNHPLLRAPVRLTTAAGATSPMVLGRREVCLPHRAPGSLAPEELRALVAHEVAHVIRRDRYWFMLIAGLESALCIQPLNRIGRRELRRLAEFSCDEWAARRVANPLALARGLVEVAAWSQHTLPATVPEAAARSSLHERVQRLVVQARPVTRRQVAPFIAALLALALVLPALTLTTADANGAAAESSAYWEGYELGRRYAATGLTDSSAAKPTPR